MGLQPQTISYRSHYLPSVPGINASGPARRTDHWRSVVVVVGRAADPPHRVIYRFTGGQHIDDPGRCVGEVVVRPVRGRCCRGRLVQ
jgi:hypothetical protein